MLAPQPRYPEKEGQMEELSTLRIGNAAGFIKGPGTAFDDILRSPATDITIGSITIEPRAGNPGNTYLRTNEFNSVNALGLPNPGLAAAVAYAKDLECRAAEANKTLRWSVAGFSPEEYVRLSDELQDFGRIELNLGCPNVWSGGVQKRIPSFDIDLLEEILRQVAHVMNDHFDVKLSPYSDPWMIPQVAKLMGSFSMGHVVTCNTFPNGFPVGENGKPELGPGFGGVGGISLRYIAPGQVKMFADSGVKVIGVGGIVYAKDVEAFLAVGASGVQIGTAYNGDAGIFQEILTGLA